MVVIYKPPPLPNEDDTDKAEDGESVVGDDDVVSGPQKEQNLTK